MISLKVLHNKPYDVCHNRFAIFLGKGSKSKCFITSRKKHQFVDPFRIKLLICMFIYGCFSCISKYLLISYINYEIEIQKLLFKRSCLSCSWMTPNIVSRVYETLLKLNLRWRIFQWLLLILLNTISQRSS